MFLAGHYACMGGLTIISEILYSSGDNVLRWLARLGWLLLVWLGVAGVEFVYRQIVGRPASPDHGPDLNEGTAWKGHVRNARGFDMRPQLGLVSASAGPSDAETTLKNAAERVAADHPGVTLLNLVQ